jgi:hypothetical protein
MAQSSPGKGLTAQKGHEQKTGAQHGGNQIILNAIIPIITGPHACILVVLHLPTRWRHTSAIVGHANQTEGSYAVSKSNPHTKTPVPNAMRTSAIMAHANQTEGSYAVSTSNPHTNTPVPNAVRTSAIMAHANQTECSYAISNSNPHTKTPVLNAVRTCASGPGSTPAF